MLSPKTFLDILTIFWKSKLCLKAAEIFDFVFLWSFLCLNVAYSKYQVQLIKFSSFFSNLINIMRYEKIYSLKWYLFWLLAFFRNFYRRFKFEKYRNFLIFTKHRVFNSIIQKHYVKFNEAICISQRLDRF
jgi:hypothetical protein